MDMLIANYFLALASYKPLARARYAQVCSGKTFGKPHAQTMNWNLDGARSVLNERRNCLVEGFLREGLREHQAIKRLLQHPQFKYNRTVLTNIEIQHIKDRLRT
ncbi:MAG: hypothetical protein HYZ79_02975 [Candidatus Melainabacteria bacterium]|nr:hypothetical protein [Candidatus Melainabacteria bacterium]